MYGFKISCEISTATVEITQKIEIIHRKICNLLTLFFAFLMISLNCDVIGLSETDPGCFGLVHGNIKPFSVCISHCGQDKMAAISQSTFSSAFFLMWTIEFWITCHWSMLLILGSNLQYCCIGSGNGLALNRRQAIIWNNVGISYWRIFASLDLNELSAAYYHQLADIDYFDHVLTGPQWHEREQISKLIVVT